MLIALVKEVSQSVSDFLLLGNRKVGLPVSISVKPNKGEAVWSLETGKLVSVESPRILKTATVELGKDRLSFIAPQIRFDNANLAGEGRILQIEIELPNGQVKLEAVGEHYQRFGQRTSLAEYLVVAKIVYIGPSSEEIYKNYLRHGEKVEKADARAFAFGVTER